VGCTVGTGSFSTGGIVSALRLQPLIRNAEMIVRRIPKAIPLVLKVRDIGDILLYLANRL
jgi:hypothetical protein